MVDLLLYSLCVILQIVCIIIENSEEKNEKLFTNKYATRWNVSFSGHKLNRRKKTII